MSAEQSLKEGNLEQAKRELQEEVRKRPAEPKHRIFLFQLLAVLGEWERALTQLQVLGEMDASTLPMVHTYRAALHCEVLRSEIFAGRRSPLVLGEPEPWIAWLTQALKHMTDGHLDEAASLRERAFEHASAAPGVLDGRAFEWLGDADSRLGPVLEVVLNGRYYWVPFSRIREMSLEAPTDLRDLLWAPVSFRWANGGEAQGLVPVRYPGSEASAEGAIRLARRTEWLERGEGCFCGLGQRMFASDVGEFALLETRLIQWEAPESEGGPGPANG